MAKRKQPKPLKLLHVVKTGGTSIADLMRRSTLPVWIENGRRQDEGALYFQGHDLKWEQEDGVLYGIVIREPAEWYVSVYHHDMARKPGSEVPFAKWYETGGVNTVIPIGGTYNRQLGYAGRFCGGAENVFEMLRSLWWVGVTETLSHDVQRICDHFGIANDISRERAAGEYNEIDDFVIPKTFKLTDRWRERIRKENPRDYELYELAKELRT